MSHRFCEGLSFTLSAKIYLWKTGKAADKLRYYFCLGLSRKILGSDFLNCSFKRKSGKMCQKKNNCFDEIRRALAIYFSFCTFFTRHLRYLPIKKKAFQRVNAPKGFWLKGSEVEDIILAVETMYKRAGKAAAINHPRRMAQEKDC